MIEAMYGMGVDTLKAARALEKVGFEPAQAEALVAAFGGSVAGGAATREDLRDLRSANRADHRALRGEVAVVMLVGDKTQLGNEWYPSVVRQIEGTMIGEWHQHRPSHHARVRRIQ